MIEELIEVEVTVKVLVVVVHTVRAMRASLSSSGVSLFVLSFISNIDPSTSSLIDENIQTLPGDTLTWHDGWIETNNPNIIRSAYIIQFININCVGMLRPVINSRNHSIGFFPPRDLYV